ncbi:MAG: sulfatase-like hydrolase/transferase [Planctomycetes bacterium]|nr:sulfatase-like hydrolase/transferase [Planctomycetota bacterium]
MPDESNKPASTRSDHASPRIQDNDRLSGCQISAVRYTVGIYLLSVSWIFWYDPETPQQLQASLSALLQNALIFGVYFALDNVLKKPGLRFALAGFVAVFASICIADTILLQLLSTPMTHVISILIATGSPLTALTWAGISLLQAVFMVCLLIVIYFAGGYAHRFLGRYAITPHVRQRVAIFFLILASGYVGEQVIARSSSAYLSRTSVFPMYVRLFPSRLSTAYTIRMDPPLTETQRANVLNEIKPLDHPPHVLFVLLESFRDDLIDPELTPNLYRLSQEGLHFTRANSEAILTSLSWNVLLMDRPSYMFHFDVRRTDYESQAAWPLEILHAAGYRIQISSSTDMEVNHYMRRLRGTGDTVDRFYMAYTPSETMRNVWDNLATEKLLEWITEFDDETPQFMLYQLDSTHWDYYFDDADAVVTPYSKIVRPMRLTSQEELDLVYARYRNAARHVDNNLGRVLQAIVDRGLDDHTAIIVVSDHGESFHVGKVGHSVLQHDTRSIPIIMRLPRMEGSEQPALVSLRNVFPTLFDYLGIEGIPEHMMLGSSALPPRYGEAITLTIHGSVKQADLTLNDIIIHFDMRVEENDITFTPLTVLDHEDQPLLPMEEHLKRVPWRYALDRLVTSGRKP